MRTLDVSEGAITRSAVKRARVAATMRSTALAACAPGAFGGANPDDPAVAELQRAAEIIYHRMELGKLELGAYTTTPLIDAVIPEGATLTLVEYDTESGSTYTIVLSSTRFTQGEWRITPGGVRRVAAS